MCSQMRDAKLSFFNPSGHAARRQYLLQQVSAIPCDIFCVQEARSRAGRWHTGGWLTWRSGHERGQYGCEIWIRPTVLSPPLTLNSWRIVISQPRILVITCLAERLPLTVCSAHAPHADRPTSEARAFWRTLQEVLLRPTPTRGAFDWYRRERELLRARRACVSHRLQARRRRTRTQ